MEPINLLVCLDGNYLPRLRVLLVSLQLNNPGESFHLYLMHRSLTQEQLDGLARQCAACGCTLFPLQVDGTLFAGAPVTKRYPQEMYYRMLAPHLLPAELDRVIYLDPDTLVINPLRPLWETDLQGNLFAAAAHSGKTDLINSVNRIRLKTRHDYYNSGVLLIDLAAGRSRIDPQALFAYAAEHVSELWLPDQDLLNALFGEQILPLEDVIWNYDARDYQGYLLASGGQYDNDWVVRHTVVLHFCGRSKPWKKNYPYRFGLLYKHYEKLTDQLLARLDRGENRS